jgi:hypothetical protein
VLPIQRIFYCSTQVLCRGLTPRYGIAIRETTFRMPMSKLAHRLKNMPSNAIGTIMTTRTMSTAIFIAMITKWATAPTVATILAITAIGTS